MKKVGVSRRKVQVGFKGFVSDRDERVLGWEYSPETLNFAVDGGGGEVPPAFGTRRCGDRP